MTAAHAGSRTHPARGGGWALVAAALALIIVALLVPGAKAAMPTIDPDRTGTLVITQLEAGAGTHPGTGLPEDTAGQSAIPGVQFTATRVPGIDLTTNEGWQEARRLTVEDAAERAEGITPQASGVTGPDGRLVFSGLPLGLYYVAQGAGPSGYSTGSPFVVALPMTNPDASNQWMYEVHVYPKNARSDIDLTVSDEGAVARGDLVGWASTSSIPDMGSFDGYAIEHILPSGLSLQSGAQGVDVRFTCAGAPDLELGVDYTATVDGQRVFVEFTESGLAKLASAAAMRSLPCRIKVSYQTKVLSDGEHVVEALLYPSRAAIEAGQNAEGITRAAAATKWGPIEIIATEVGKPNVRIPGVCFQLYPSKQDAKDRTNQILIDGVGEWVTDKDGMIHVDGLRFSDFVNGKIVRPGDPLYRTYYAVVTCVPDGWQMGTGEIPVIVDSATDANVVDVELFKAEGGSQGKPPTKPSPLPKTGASVLGVLLVSAVALALGTVLKRRREDEQEAR